MARFLFCTASILLLLLVAGAAGVPQRHQVSRRARAYLMREAPTLDGRVDEPQWRAMEPLAGFIQQEPNEGQPASEPTEVRVGYDQQYLYIGIICYDSQPDQIVVTQNRRDAPLTDTDSVQILLDTFHDHQNAFIFGTSPTGIEFDGQVSKAGQGRGGAGAPARAGGQGSLGGSAQRGGASAFNLNWDGVWRVRSRITERGWESEMAIPFKTLRYWPGPHRVWGINVMRNLRRRNEQSFWSPVSRAFYFTQVELVGELEGLDLTGQRNLQLLPYALGGLRQDYTVAAAGSRMARNAGLDVKYSLTPSLTLDATFNTDFAQVEVDEEQVNLTRFDLFSPEKRPFFLKNSGTFKVGTPREVELFFSRRIGIDESGAEAPIDAGLRLTGKAGPYALGLLEMKTRAVAGVGPANHFSVLRVSRELPNRSSVGVIAVNRQSAGGVEGARAFNRTWGKESGFDYYHFDTRWQNGSRLCIAFNRNYERLDAPFEISQGVKIRPGSYGYSEVTGNFISDPTAPLFAEGNVSAGNFYGGRIRTINVSGGYRQGAKLSWTGAGSATGYVCRKGTST